MHPLSGLSPHAVLAALCLGLTAAAAPPATAAPAGTELRALDGDYVIRDFHFASGETLPELRLHYTYFGRQQKDAQGRVTNAVLILHGTGGSGRSLINDRFSGVLFGHGQLLDAQVFHHPARRHRPREIQQTERCVAFSLSAVRL
jgi:homoserine O-acetyltransferase